MRDIAIIGGGATGGALALGVNNHTDYQVELIDAGEPPAIAKSTTGFDQRTIALSHASMTHLNHIGVNLNALATSPIKHIHVSDQYHAGQTRLHASEHNIDGFGYVVSLAQLGAQIYADFLPNQSSRMVYRPSTQVVNIERSNHHSDLYLSNGECIQARLVVLAEGGRTGLAEALGLQRTITDYGQTALTFVVEATEPHQQWAYERFTQQGPLAFLPLTEHQFGVVWTVNTDTADGLLALPERQFIAQLQQAFGYRCGLLSLNSKLERYPLALRQLNSPFTHGVVAVGNAAQSLHPIAGQGVNLGFRDVADLIDYSLANDGESFASYTNLANYAKQRMNDKARTVALTDGLVRLFSNDYGALVLGRNTGLTAMNINQLAKNEFAQQAMGY